MMVGVTAVFQCREGVREEFEAAFRDLAEQVRAHEPGNRLYQAFKSREKPNSYVMLEIFDSQLALDAHNASDHFKAALPKVSPMVDGSPEIQYFDAI